ncbi:MAG: B12-binding domain-containing radical SAM protein [Desulfobacterales bacterium]|nr:B12-binding domain-containing radical SAM protein [Desulfobacterales bacterium]
MNIVFYDISYENVGLQILAAILRRNNYPVTIIYKPIDTFNFMKGFSSKHSIDKAVEQILNHKPDIVGFSLFSFTYPVYREISRKIKLLNNKIIVLFGGIHATLSGKQIMEDDFVDFMIMGEAEDAILELLDSLQAKKDHHQIKNLCYRENGNIYVNPLRPYIRNLDRLPIPDKSEYYKKHPFLGIRYHIMATRGCFFRCTYCSNNALQKRYNFEKNHIRYRTPDHVIKELIIAKEKYHPKTIYFIDDLFTSNKEWLTEFSFYYHKKINIPVECLTHPIFITDEIADLLKIMDTRIVGLGIQTADEYLRKTILNRHELNKDVQNAIQILKEKKIMVSIDHIFGFPGETKESIIHSIKTYSNWNPKAISINWFECLPNTDIIYIALDKYGKSAESFDEKNKKKYIKYELLMNLIGLIPGRMVQYFANNIKMFPASRFMLIFLYAFSHVFLIRRPWVMAFILQMIKNKFNSSYINN